MGLSFNPQKTSLLVPQAVFNLKTLFILPKTSILVPQALCHLEISFIPPKTSISVPKALSHLQTLLIVQKTSILSLIPKSLLCLCSVILKAPISIPKLKHSQEILQSHDSVQLNRFFTPLFFNGYSHL